MVRSGPSHGVRAKTETLVVESPAKINLILDILRKRADGYHEVRTIFQKIGLFDLLRFTLKKEKGVLIATDHPALPTGRQNLVYRAAEVLLRRSDYRGGVNIQITKRIPLGAGLGGGSSNAAAALKALNGLLALGMSRRELMEIGVEIGADVPFFLMEGAAVGTGIGDKLRRTTLPAFWYVLIYPNFEVSTRWAYANVVLTKKRFRLKVQGFPRDPQAVGPALRNDLEPVVSSKHPQIAMMKEMLCLAGALGASMTGSGPTVFGLFPSEPDASKAYRKVSRRCSTEGWTAFKANNVV